MKIKFAIFLLFISIVGIGCSPKPDIGFPTSTASEEILIAPDTPITPTEALTPDPFPLTLQANQTQNAIHEINRNAQQTNEALTPTKTPSSTFTPIPTSIYGINESEFEPNYSTNGEWIAFIPKSGKPEIYVSNKEGAVQWHIDYYCFEAGCYPGAWIVPLHWTADNKFFFFGLQVSMDGAGIFLQDGIAIRRLNLENGDISDYLPGDASYYAFAFSPSGRQLIYIPQTGYSLQITLLDIWTGEIRKFPLNPMFAVAGRIVWFQDETKIAFITANGFEHDDENLAYFIMVFDLPTQSFSSVYQGADRYDPIEWLSYTELIIKTGEETFVLNITTRDIFPYVGD